ncbi:MAG: YbaB/EbfC family nucleoid-associated protein [Anaerolineales bacterium]|nr:YbaB/EbfC family nucleoid-associated protein [Anaerolineales bacterium]
MAKLKGNRPPPGLNAGLMERMAKLQDEMRQAQDELAEQRLTVQAGGEAVKVVIDGRQRIHQIEIAPAVMAQGDRELLQDLLVVALNNALEQSQTMAAERLQSLNASLGLPGL